ncbi:LCP family protein [Corynebacterium minutissimum]|uniref:LCP family protein n=1 Tax=Corynebacterium minutissimum TaxID=38301 RepID=A0A2X4RW57_9CORY|nr:LCP family protein [Corynebacterium minutissimum]QPS60575.1 LCP family protein [Corynebacterium minutissimum]QQA78637.1 LCP family protein [Corynebacterium minutissimum]SQI00560.1 transcriptional regulator, LytR family [Corynebacterium minutissimum]VEG05372.1 transcriptional regulator, LytR family [Corynebacterium minutissimum]
MTSPNSPRAARHIQAAPSQSAPATQHGSTPVKALVAFLSAVVLVLSGVGYFTVGKLGNDISSASNLALGNDGGFKDKGIDGAVDILLVGKDSRTDAKGNPLSEQELADLHAGVDEGEENTDTIMVIRIPNDGSRATAVSIPRDTYVHDSEFGNTKINAVFALHKSAKMEELQQENAEAEALGKKPPHTEKEMEQASTEAGRTGLISMVRTLTDVSVDHYAEVGLLGFVLLTDAVGGVDVCLNNDVDDPMSGAKFPKGRQTLQGAEGLSFVRQRYELPRGDLDRIVRQQAYMASLTSKVLDSDTLTSPGKLNKIADAVERSVVIDDDWDIMGFVTQLAGLAGGNVTFTTIPVTSISGTGDYGESVVTIDAAEVHRFMDDLAKSQEKAEAEQSEEGAADEAANDGEKPVAEGLNLHVLNAGTVDGMAGGIGTWLKNVGYTVERTANAQSGIYAESQIVAADANDERALALAEQLGGLPVTANEELEPDTFIVVATDDYAGPKDDSAMEQEAEAESNQVAEDQQVGTPGDDFGTAEVAPEIDAGGDGPRCVN